LTVIAGANPSPEDFRGRAMLGVAGFRPVQGSVTESDFILTSPHGMDSSSRIFWMTVPLVFPRPRLRR
jgi:hypothetical protein